MCLIIANVLATSYCNLAAPLVCLDLWEHVESINFSKGRCPAKFLEARSPGRRPLRAKLAGGFFAEIGANPDRELFCTRQQDAAEKRRGLLLLILSTTSYCLVKLVCWRSRRGERFWFPREF